MHRDGLESRRKNRIQRGGPIAFLRRLASELARRVAVRLVFGVQVEHEANARRAAPDRGHDDGGGSRGAASSDNARAVSRDNARAASPDNARAASSDNARAASPDDARAASSDDARANDARARAACDDARARATCDSARAVAAVALASPRGWQRAKMNETTQALCIYTRSADFNGAQSLVVRVPRLHDLLVVDFAVRARHLLQHGRRLHSTQRTHRSRVETRTTAGAHRGAPHDAEPLLAKSFRRDRSALWSIRRASDSLCLRFLFLWFLVW